jgi:hypothetical protein
MAWAWMDSPFSASGWPDSCTKQAATPSYATMQYRAHPASAHPPARDVGLLHSVDQRQPTRAATVFWFLVSITVPPQLGG